MDVVLRKAEKKELDIVHKLQIAAFKNLLTKYQDYDTNPGAEPIEKIIYRFNQPFTTYYFIVFNNIEVGAIRIIYSEKESLIRISPMFVHPDYQNQNIGQKAVKRLEEIYSNVKVWTLDTILQEPQLCHFYEKSGFTDTGKRENIKEGMDIKFYHKLKKHDT